MPITDKTWGYWVESINAINPDLKLQFDYMNQDLSVDAKHSFLYTASKDDRTLLSQLLSASFVINNVGLTPIKNSDGNMIQSMVFIGQGSTPKVDADPNPFDFENTTEQDNRIYFFQPSIDNAGNSILSLRNYDNNIIYNSLRTQLGLKFKDD